MKNPRLKYKSNLPRMKLRFAGLDKKTAYSLFAIPHGWKFQKNESYSLPDASGEKYLVIKLKRVIS
jgi:hypothetical protein